mmetsp:Transcript_8414/g.14216  ORF Transcript_8414/g.14216 Transcript_8414/m.14216 type:complete len:340 (+) Transcript_8414:76-1095(+)
MPTVFIDTSATVEVGPFLNGCSPKLAAAVGAPKEHVHIVLRCAQCMTWGSKLGGVDGAPHTAQIRVVCGDELSAEQKAKVVAGVGGMLSKFVPSASTQFCFDVVGTANLFIDGACLSGMAPPPKAEKPKKEAPPQQAKDTPEEKAAKQAAKDAEKLLKAVIKEGGKKGVEIEGAADMGGLEFFCTTCETPDGDLKLLQTCMDAMNAEPDPEAEDRKGCSGAVGKMIFSAGTKQLAMVGYVPEDKVAKVEIKEWMEAVCKAVDGKIEGAATKAVSPNGGFVISAVVLSDPEKGKFALKDKDAAMAAGFAHLRSKGAFPDDDGDDSDEMVFGDDDNLDDYA